MSQDLRHIPIHRALNRPDLMAGCERELLLLTGLITLTLVVVALNTVAAITGVIIWTACVAGLRAMAKADPYMSKVYLRHIKYKAFYPAHSTPFALGAVHTREK
jgi:type IV secretion system protein VirB3